MNKNFNEKKWNQIYLIGCILFHDIHAYMCFLFVSFQLHHHHPTKHQSSQFNHKTKKRLLYMFWSRNQKNNKKLLFQRPHQLNQANQKYTSSNTRLKRNQAVVAHTQQQVVVALDLVLIWAHQDQLAAVVAVLISEAADTDRHQPNTDLLENLDHTKLSTSLSLL